MRSRREAPLAGFASDGRFLFEEGEPMRVIAGLAIVLLAGVVFAQEPSARAPASAKATAWPRRSPTDEGGQREAESSRGARSRGVLPAATGTGGAAAARRA